MLDTEEAARRLLADATSDIPPGIDLLPGFRKRRAARRVRGRITLGLTGTGALAAATAVAFSLQQAPSALAAVTSAAAQTAAQSYQVEAAYSVPAPPGRHARVDRLTGRFSPSAAIGVDDGHRFRITGGYLYQQLGRGGHALWLRVPTFPMRGARAGYAALLVGTAPSVVVGPEELLALLKSASHVWRQGSTSGPGWTGTRYAFTATRSFGPAGSFKFAGTVGVDQQGRVRQFNETITTTLAHPPRGMSRTQVQTVKVAFGHFGVPVSATAPPAGQVVMPRPKRALP